MGLILGQGADTPQAVGQLESLRAAGKTQHDKKEKKVCERERRKERESERTPEAVGRHGESTELGAQDAGLHSSSAVQVRDWISAAWCSHIRDYLVLYPIPYSPKS